MFKNLKEGISIRRIHILLIFVILFSTVTVVYSTFRLTNAFLRLSAAADEHAELKDAAHELIDASDYLTEQVQRFTVDGNVRFMENYFTEAFETARREEAVSKMNADGKTESAFAHLQEAMDNSVKLMNQEYYAMKLVIEAKGYTEYPDLLNGIELTTEDADLTSEDKMRRATELVLNDDYYRQKDMIRTGMKESIREVDELMQKKQDTELAALRRELNVVRIVILLQALLIIFMMRLTSLFGIHPILRAVDRIKADDSIPEVGANEFRYLARAYNKMYEKNKSSIENLNFKASHDELTGAYNRFGYDFLLSNIDLRSSYMMLFDVDNFKSINDTYGHEIGDKVLIKLVRILSSIFRDDDCICRIGGDEFVVFMVHSSGMPRRLIESKISQINEELEKTGDGLPPISISVGIVNGKDVSDTGNLFEKTDAAMYESKKQGKHTYTFYDES